MTYTLAVMNQMGGAGKTTTSINVAGALADQGADVLLIDADPQGTATEGVGMEELYDREMRNLHDVLSDLDQTAAINDIVIEDHEEFDLIPANIQMFQTAQELMVGVPQSEAQLRTALEALDRAYDYVVIDCPPNLGQLSDNALLAAERVLIPVQAKRRSIRALEILGQQVERLEAGYQTSIDRLGIVVNEVEYPLDGDSEEMLDWFDDLGFPTWEIRSRVSIKRAWNHGLSVFGYDDEEECDQAETYAAIADALASDAGIEDEVTAT